PQSAPTLACTVHPLTIGCAARRCPWGVPDRGPSRYTTHRGARRRGRSLPDRGDVLTLADVAPLDREPGTSGGFDRAPHAGADAAVLIDGHGLGHWEPRQAGGDAERPLVRNFIAQDSLLGE